MCATLSAAAQQTPKVTLETSPTLFSVLAAINSCGYNQELSGSAPVRAQVRADIDIAVRGSAEAAQARDQLCAFYRDHQQPDPSRDLAQYISLALNLGDPPTFPTLLKESDLPPDASYVLGLLPLLQRFYTAAGLQKIWDKHAPDYEALVASYHEPVRKLLLDTDVYLKLPVSGYLGRHFVVYIEPMQARGQVNARNYGSDYYVVTTPERGELTLDQIRHTYLHYVLDPLAMKRANTMKRLEPLLETVRDAPMDDSYKRDAALMVTEALIRAIEARTLPRATEPQKRQAAQASEEEGFVLTDYFFEALQQFEKNPTGMRDAYGDLLYNIDLGRERKRALETHFRRQAAPELVKASKGRPAQVLSLAEQRLSSGDPVAAQKLAQEALDKKIEDPARALFILARAASLNRDMGGARAYFERTLEVAKEPRLLAWSHIYLGRIFDLQENRDAAMMHYRAALAAGDPAPATRAAAERGLQEPYQPPRSAEQTGEGQQKNPQ